MVISRVGLTPVNLQNYNGVHRKVAYSSARAQFPLGRDSVSFGALLEPQKTDTVQVCSYPGAKQSRFQNFIVRGVNEAYEEYSPIFKEAGVKDIPKPSLVLGKGVERRAYAHYSIPMNQIRFNSDDILSSFIENKCYLMDKDGKYIYLSRPYRGYLKRTSIFVKYDPEVKELAKRVGAKICDFDERALEPLIDGLTRHEMRHWAQAGICINNPKTYESFNKLCLNLSSKNKRAIETFGLKEMATYVPANVDITFTRDTSQGNIVYRATDFMKDFESVNKAFDYHALNCEIDANWEAYKFLSKKYKNVADADLDMQIKVIKRWFLQYDPYFDAKKSIMSNLSCQKILKNILSRF